MDVYVFGKTKVGRAHETAQRLAENRRVARAVAVTGEYDVLARAEGLSWEELASFCLDELASAGLKNTTTVVSVDWSAQWPDIPIPPIPFMGGHGGKHSALVFVNIRPGAAADVIRRLSESESVHGLALLTGAYDLLLQIGGNSFEDIAGKVLSDIQPVDGVESTNTSLVLVAEPGYSDQA